MNKDKPVILTGLRANNGLHIGNYYGALKPMIDLINKHAEDYQVNLFVPDLHSFTTPIDHSMLNSQIMDNLKVFVAAGLPLDEDNVHIYRQSYIPAHSELTWILDCFTGFGELSRMTQFKDKSQDSNDRVSVGLFNYPVLMASDILLYDAKYVPVGEDQTQHIEFTRDIAIRFNSTFGDIFTVPVSVQEQHKFFGSTGLRIKDLVNPEKKMSKSTANDSGVIFLDDDPKKAAKKISSATTDSMGSINYDKVEQPGITNLLEVYSLVSGQELKSVVEKFKGQTLYGSLKKELASLMEEFLISFQTRLSEVDTEKIEAKLLKSEEIMRHKSNETLLKAQKAVGLRA